ncbi:hypothetical protein HK405_008933 [Cladochytrium tenue]|nr:hypothetical protein HK405_008933 [Cladochytrium tenue]
MSDNDSFYSCDSSDSDSLPQAKHPGSRSSAKQALRSGTDLIQPSGQPMVSKRYRCSAFFGVGPVIGAIGDGACVRPWSNQVDVGCARPPWGPWCAACDRAEDSEEDEGEDGPIADQATNTAWSLEARSILAFMAVKESVRRRSSQVVLGGH